MNTNSTKQWSVKLEEDGEDVILNFPPDLLEEAGWKEGDTLTFDTDGDKIIIRKVNDT